MEKAGLRYCTGARLILMSKVQCLFHTENCTTEGRGGEKGVSPNTKTKHTEPLTTELVSSLYILIMLVIFILYQLLLMEKVQD